MHYPSGTTVEYVAGQDRNQFHQILVNGTAMFDFAYLGEERVQKVDIHTGSSDWVELHAYDAVGRATGIDLLQGGASGAAMFQLAYTLNDEGQVDSIWRSDSAATVSADYDSAGQLSSFGTEAFDYDLASNLTLYTRGGFSTSLGVNDYNRLDSVATLQPVHDGVGNMTQFANIDYVYDYENRLRRILHGGNLVWEAWYDALGRRVKTVRGSETRYFTWFGDRMVEVMEDSDGGLVETSRILGHRADDVLMVRQGGVDLFTARDPLGSVLAVFDAAGSLVERYTYSAFGGLGVWDPNGNPLSAPTTGLEAYFTGRPCISEGGQLVDLRTRFFRPGLTRFLTRDSIGFEGGWNLYAYTENSPLDSADWMGTDSDSKWEEIVNAADPGGRIRGELQAVKGGAIGAGIGFVGFTVSGVDSTSTGATPKGTGKGIFSAVMKTLAFGEGLKALYKKAFALEDELFNNIGSIAIEMMDTIDWITGQLEAMAKTMEFLEIDHHTFNWLDSLEVTIDFDGTWATGTIEGGWDFNVNLKTGDGVLRSPDGKTMVYWDKDNVTVVYGDGTQITRHKTAPHKGWTTVCNPGGKCITYDEKGKRVKDPKAKPKVPKPAEKGPVRIPGAKKKPKKVELEPVKPRPSDH